MFQNDECTEIRNYAILNGRYQSAFKYRGKNQGFRQRLPRKAPWESLFMRKSKYEKRLIIQQPWQYPMAAQNLSAMIIQKLARGMLCRLKAIGVQRRTITKKAKAQTVFQKFIIAQKGNKRNQANNLRYYCATRIQSWYKACTQRRKYILQRFPLYHIAAMQIQYVWRSHYEKMYLGAVRVSPLLEAVYAVQKWWRSSTYKRIYRYYRDLILFRNTGDPALMLKAINPSEASLIDAATGMRVRFRLGGFHFPPTIYYKLFTSSAVCDMNSFSPKDYTASRKRNPHVKQQKEKKFIRVGNSYFGANQCEQESDNWYSRIENNGWRPVNVKVLADGTNEELVSKPRSTFHYSKVVRKKDIEKQRKLRKREWLQKMYREGLIKEKEDMENNRTQTRSPCTIDFDSPRWEEEADEILQWTKDLDYDDYLRDWHAVGTSNRSDSLKN